ncbi:MAG TPA: hypothetical protein PLZ57_11515 [Pseudobdellovibrionaceae bacterium]|nr:hypothetical protein [Pseudobdellovibrionaceae bacterium]
MLSGFWGEKPRRTQALALGFAIVLLSSRVLHLQSWPLTGFSLFDRPRVGDQIQAFAFRCSSLDSFANSLAAPSTVPHIAPAHFYPQFFMDPFLVDRVVSGELTKAAAPNTSSINFQHDRAKLLLAAVGEELMRISQQPTHGVQCELVRRATRFDPHTRKTWVRDVQLWVSSPRGEP